MKRTLNASRLTPDAKRLTPLCLALCLLLIAGSALAKTATMTRPRGKRIYDTKFLDINRWNLPFYNNGEFGIDLTQLNFPGGYWPAPKKNFHLFGGGIWIGAISAANETLVSIGYNPNSGGCEFYPTLAKDYAGGTGNSSDRVYKYGTADWPPDASRFGADHSLVPQENFSLQDIWLVCTDAAPGQHVSPGKPLGIDVFLTVYAWNYPANQDIFFLNYKVRNSTGDATGTKTDLRNVYFGVCEDCDIGDATDDMVGMILNRVFNNGADTVRNVGFIGDNDNRENPSDRWEGGQPGICAMKFLESPRRPDGEQFGMTAFKKFTIDIDPVTDPTQYLTMAGIDYRTGIYNAYDSLDEAVQDKRIIQCSGPFDLPADSVQSIIVANFACYYGAENELWSARTEADMQEIVRTAQSAQFIYDRGWLLPGPPESPTVTLIPMDNKVRITWDNAPETQPDRYYIIASDSLNVGWDPRYKQFDFQGYKVWKSRTGAEWDLLTQCDIADGDTFSDTTVVDSIRTKATDSGIFYSVIDDSVINGYTYYYAVSAYDHNWTTVFDSLHVPIDSVRMASLEGGKRSVAVTPRWEPSNLVAASASVVKVTGDQTSPALTCSAAVVVPFKVTGDTYVLQMLEPKFISSDKARYQWIVKDKRSDSLVLDTSGVTYTLGDYSTARLVRNDLATVGGLTTKMKLKMGVPDSSFGAVTAAPNYPLDSLKSMPPAASGRWAYRGSDIQITWHRTGTKVTADVIDVTNGGIPIPFIHYGTDQNARPESANGYCFVNNVFKFASESLPATYSYFYCTGGYLALNKGASPHPIGSLLDLIQEGDVWQISGYKRKMTSPAYNTFYIFGTPESIITRPDTSIKLKVRVVPNPYFITDAWETNAYTRRMAFTGLPAVCDIRIFNLAGDLVKHIKHTETRAPYAGQAEPQPGELGGTEFWDLINDNKQLIATGVYIFHVKSDVGEYVGKLAIAR
jgi:hypothetical protein